MIDCNHRHDTLYRLLHLYYYFVFLKMKYYRLNKNSYQPTFSQFRYPTHGFLIISLSLSISAVFQCLYKILKPQFFNEFINIKINPHSNTPLLLLQLNLSKSSEIYNLVKQFRHIHYWGKDIKQALAKFSSWKDLLKVKGTQICWVNLWSLVISIIFMHFLCR